MKNSFAKPVCFSKLLYFIVIIFISGQVFNGLLFFQNKKRYNKIILKKKNHRKLKEKTYYLWYKHTQFVEKVDREMTQSFDGGKVVEGGLNAQWAQYIYFFFYQKKKKIIWWNISKRDFTKRRASCYTFVHMYMYVYKARILGLLNQSLLSILRVSHIDISKSQQHAGN